MPEVKIIIPRYITVGKTLMRTFTVLLLFYSLVDVNTYDRTPFLRGSVVVVLNRLDF
jgi:hypothetical protein